MSSLDERAKELTLRTARKAAEAGKQAAKNVEWKKILANSLRRSR